MEFSQEMNTSDVEKRDADTTHLIATIDIYRQLKARRDELQEQLKDVTDSVRQMEDETIPNLMDEAGVISLETDDVDLSLKQIIQANIASGWPEEKRRAGFDYIIELGEGDLIRAEVRVDIDRQDDQLAIERARALARNLEHNGYAATTKEGIPFQTLSAWLRRWIDSGHPLPDLEKIGGFIGRKAVIKEKK